MVISIKRKSSLHQQGSCGSSASSFSDATYENILQKVVAPEIVAAWTDCRKGGFFINGDLNGDTLALEFRFRPMGPISRTTLIEDPRITGASCPRPGVKARTVLTNAPKYQSCQRSGTGPVTVIANSTMGGARFFIPAVPPPAPPAPPPPEVPQVLVGNYQVRLGPGGGCNGGPANSFPRNLAKITIDNAGAVFATNECNDTSRLSVVDNGHGYWWGQPISFDLSNGGVTISEDRPKGNSWQKVQR